MTRPKIASLGAWFTLGMTLVFAGEPPAQPFLRLDARMHTGRINRISADQSGQVILTIGQDKTARVWELPSGNLRNILRPPIGQHLDGTLFSGSLSPDGKLAAVGGFTGLEWDQSASVYLFDTSSSEMSSRLSELPSPPLDLEFSPDGSFLAAALSRHGLKLWRTNSWAPLILETLPEGALAVAWGINHQLAAISRNGAISVYQVDGDRLQTVSSKQLSGQPNSLAFSPDGGKLAIGYLGPARVDVLDSQRLHHLNSPAASSVKDGSLSAVAWGRTPSALGRGDSVIAAGSWFQRDGGGGDLWFPIRLWTKAGDGRARDVQGPKNSVFDLKALPNGSIAYASSVPSWGVINSSAFSKQAALKIGGAASGGQELGSCAIADFSGMREEFRVSSDGSVIEFRYSPVKNRSTASFSIDDGRLTQGASRRALKAPRVTGLPVTGWSTRSASSLRFRDRSLDLPDTEAPTALAIDPSSNPMSFALGTIAFLRLYSSQGELLWKQPALGEVSAVNLTQDGRFVIAAYGNGAIKWHHMDDGREILTFFPHADQKRWVVWATNYSKETLPTLGVGINTKAGGSVFVSGVKPGSAASVAGFREGDQMMFMNGKDVSKIGQFVETMKPVKAGESFAATVRRNGAQRDIRATMGSRTVINYEGGAFFNCAPNSEDLIGWHLNQGAEKAAKFVSGEQLFSHFYRPDIVWKAFKELRSPSEIANALGVGVELQSALKGAPEVSIVGLPTGGKSGVNKVTVKVVARDTGHGIRDVRLFHNGKRTSPDGPKIVQGNSETRQYTLTLLPGKNKLEAVAFNVNKTQSKPVFGRIDFAGESKAYANLYILGAGLNRYRNSRYNLNYCLADLNETVSALTTRGDKIYGKIIPKVLRDDEVTKESLKAAFDEIASRAGNQDVFIFVFAGHGTMSSGDLTRNQDPEFFLVPHDVTKLYGDDDQLLEKAVSGTEIQRWCADVPAQKQLLLLDTCQSGGLVKTFAMRGAAEERAIAQLARATGTTVIASTGTEQYATEFEQLGHGVFTFAFLEALREGKADGNRDGRITVKEIDLYINDRVPELTEEYRGTAQFPNSYARGQDFPIGLSQ